jgi:hypothetical protein
MDLVDGDRGVHHVRLDGFLLDDGLDGLVDVAAIVVLMSIVAETVGWGYRIMAYWWISSLCTTGAWLWVCVVLVTFRWSLN